MGVGKPMEAVSEKDIKQLSSLHAEEACALVQRVFDATIAPTYQQLGREHFHSFVDPVAFAARLDTSSHFALGAYNDSLLIGMIEVRDLSHICLLFTDLAWQGKGVGSLLVQKAQERCLGSLDVNAAPGAVSFYQNMGFVPTSEEQETDGIRYIPMRKNFSE